MPTYPKLRLRLRTLAIVIGIIAIGIQVSLYYLSPTRRLSRRLLAEQPDYVRREAAIGLGSQIPPWEVDQAIGVLIDALSDPSPRVRESAAAGLAGHGTRAGYAGPKLIGLLIDSDRGVRASATGALGLVTEPSTPESETAVAAITRNLDDNDMEVRLAAIQALIRQGEVDSIARPLASVMGDTEAYYQNRVRTMIDRLGINRQRLIAGFISALGAPDHPTRRGALQLLILYAPVDVIALALRNAAQDSNPEIRRWAMEQAERLIPDRIIAPRSDSKL